MKHVLGHEAQTSTECGAENPDSLFTNMRNFRFNTRRRKETEGGGDEFPRVPAVDSGTKHRDHVSSAGALFLTSYLRVSGSWVASFCFTYFILLKSYCQNFLKQTRYLKIKTIF